MLTVRKREGKKFSGESLFVAFPYNPLYVGKVKAMPNRWYHPENKEWEVPKEDMELLLNRFNNEEIKLEGIENVSVEEDIEERLRNIIPVMDYEFKLNPYPHQIEGFNEGLEKNNLLIGDEQGLGKTKQAIDVAVARKIKGQVKKCLIVCGINGNKYNWKKEVWKNSNEKAVVMDNKSIDKRAVELREWLLDNEVFFGIINIESIRKEKIIGMLQKAIDNNYLELVVVDEIHKAKNGLSKQGKALQKIQPPFKMGLTGTPLHDKAEDLWNILYWFGIEKRSFYRFRNRYCIMGGFKNKKVVSYKNLDELYHILNKVMLRRKKDEVLDLPEKIYIKEYVEMGSKQKRLYEEIKRAIIMEIEDILIMNNPLSKLTRLRQVTSGIIGEDNVKLDRLKELLDEEIIPNGKKAVIYSNWTKVTERLLEELEKYNPAYITGEVDVEERQKQEDKFQNDENCKIIIGTIGAMGTGRNLYKGSYVIFLDKAWSYSDNEQAIDRLHRIGTEGAINVISLIAEGTIDEKIEGILEEKKELINNVVEGSSIDRRGIRDIVEELLDIKEG